MIEHTASPYEQNVDANAVERTLSLALSEALAVGRRDESLALQLGELDPIDLPPTYRPQVDAATLRSAAPLYLASQLEAILILQAVEKLAGVAVSGGLPLEHGTGSRLLYEFWNGRTQRFSEEERQAFFARLFGTSGPSLAISDGRNAAFPVLMLELAEAVHQFDVRSGEVAGADTSLRMAALQMADNLMPRSGGLASFAGREIVTSIQSALGVLKQPDIQRAIGARNVWSALQQIAERYLRRRVQITQHVQRGRAGMQLLTWLADVLLKLDDYQRPLITPDEAVRGAAFNWLQASLTLGERQKPAQQAWR